MKILILSIVTFFQFLSGNVTEFLSAHSLSENIEADSTINQTQLLQELSLIHISEPRDQRGSRMPSSA